MLVLRNLSLVGQNRIFGGSVRLKFGMNQILIINQWTRWQINSWEYIQRMIETVPKWKLSSEIIRERNRHGGMTKLQRLSRNRIKH